MKFIGLTGASILVLTAVVFSQELDSRNMEIPANEKEMKHSLESFKQSRDRKIMLHYRIGTSDRLACLLYTSGPYENPEDHYGRLGIEPAYFTKPSDGLYQVSIGLWGKNLKKAMRDNPEAYEIMKRYQEKAIFASILLAAGVISGLVTAVGLVYNEYIFDDSRDYHLINGTSASIAFLSLWTVPKLINRGQIHKAQKVYNK